MMPRSVFLPLAPIFAVLALVKGHAQFDNFDDLTNLSDQIEILGEGISYDPDNEEVVYEGSVSIEYGKVSIYADLARYDTQRRVVEVEGNVTIYQGPFVYRGEDATYNLATERLSSRSIRTYAATTNGLVFTEAGHFDIDVNDTEKITTHQSFLTAHDNPNPNWRIDADQIDIYPEERLVFRNLFFRIGDVPVFWLPYFSQPFDNELGYQFTPGFESDWGAYLLNRYGVVLGKDGHTTMQVHLDGRAERGLASGVRLRSTRWRGERDWGELFFYYAQDSSPLQGSSKASRRRVGLDTGRYRINLQHRIYLRGYNDTWDLDPDTGESRLVHRGKPVDPNLYLDADLNYISDEFFYEDFFPSEARINPQPDSILQLVRRDPRFEASALTRLRLNDVFTRDERLPELAIDAVRQPLWNTGILYQGGLSAGYLTEELAISRKRQLEERRTNLLMDMAELAVPSVEQQDQLASLERQLEGRGFFRADTYHQFSKPFLVGGALQLVPRAGVRATSWNNVRNGDDELRILGHVGLDASMKFTRRWDQFQNPGLGVDGLMHVFQPYLNWSYVGGDEIGQGFRGIDILPQSTRSKTLDLAQYQAIDEIYHWNILRLGAFNHLLTKRNGKSYAWLSYNTFFDIFLDDAELNRDFSNWHHEIDFRPLPWLALNMEGQLPLSNDDHSFTEWNVNLRWMPKDWFEFRIGHRLLEDSPFFRDSNQITTDSFLRINEDWGLSMAHRYEIDDGTLEYQQYSIHRDLETWTTALTLLMRDERRETNFGVLFNVSLKQFPQASLPISLTPGGGSRR